MTVNKGLNSAADFRALDPLSQPPVLAMAHHRLGQKEQARAALHSGQVIFTEKMPDPAAGRPFDRMWPDWLHCQILLREAEALLTNKSDVGDHTSANKRITQKLK
jgi:hypothetical protein